MEKTFLKYCKTVLLVLGIIGLFQNNIDPLEKKKSGQVNCRKILIMYKNNKKISQK